MAQQAKEASAGFLVLAVDWEEGTSVALASPEDLSEAVDVAKNRAESTMNPEEVVYVLPSIVAYRPHRD